MLTSYCFNTINRLLSLCCLSFSWNTQDSGGRLQKHVLLKRDNGDVVSFYVRKMVYGSQPKQLVVPKKRPEPTEDSEPKKEHAEGVRQKKKRSKKHGNKENVSVVEWITSWEILRYPYYRWMSRDWRGCTLWGEAMSHGEVCEINFEDGCSGHGEFCSFTRLRVRWPRL